MEHSIIRTEYSELMQKSYIDYAMSVIIARALPDVRDGLLIGEISHNARDFRKPRQIRRCFPAVSGHHFIAAWPLGPHQGGHQYAVLLHALRHFLHGRVHPHLKRVIGKVADFCGVQIDNPLQPVLRTAFFGAEQVIDTL